MGVLVDHQIRWYCCRGDRVPLVEPYVESQVQPASYDVRLDNVFLRIDPEDPSPIDLGDRPWEGLYERFEVPPGEPFVLPPQGFVLGGLAEYVRIPPELVCRVEGKSSLGRMGLEVHLTAGYIDPGFNGRITLELYNVHRRIPLLLWPGDLIAQLSFEMTAGIPDQPYQGRYQGDAEATGSRYNGGREESRGGRR